MIDFLKKVPLFSELSDEDLSHLAEMVNVVEMDPGMELFAEGSPCDAAFIIKHGAIEIFKKSAGREVLLAVREAGEVLGEMSLLEKSTRMAGGRARGKACVLRIEQQQFNHLLETSASAALAMFRTVITRWRSTEATLRQSEKLAQLGTLTAGVAHELNNPAAAARRGADQLARSLAKLQESQLTLFRLDLSEDQLGELARLAEMTQERAGKPLDLDPLEQSDRESEMEDALDDLDVDEPWELALALLNMGLHPEQLASLDFPQLSPILAWLVHGFSVFNLLAEIAQGTGRISEIVKSMKSYAYLDQAPLQDVDVHEGLDSTLVLLRGKLKQGITVRREYADGLPRIQAYGSELNQVWTNIIDNASMAMDGKGDLCLRTRLEDDLVVIEVEDNGPGIPPKIQQKIFDPFFTTKAPGEGTGLGLHISYNIIVDKHRGQLSVDSEPGRTTFRAKLPLRPEQS